MISRDPAKELSRISGGLHFAKAKQPKRRNPEPCRDCGAPNATTEVGDQGMVCTKCARRYSPCAVCKTKLLPENLTTVGGRELCEPCEEDVRYKNMPRDNGKARKNPHSGTDTPRIYVADLGAYNAGKLKGEWSFQGVFTSEEDFARGLLEDVGISEEHRQMYVDFEAIGRDLHANGEDDYLEMSAREAGEKLVDDIEGVGHLPDADHYFDYKAFARDLFINDYCAMDCKGGVCVFRRS